METFKYFNGWAFTMTVKNEMQEQITEAISEAGASGATTIEIEKKVSIERHTLSKYLVYMQGLGIVYHKAVGKAKIWHINNAPLQTIVKSPSEHKTFAENILLNLVSNIPVGIFVTDKDYNIQFMNSLMAEKYGNLENEKFYTGVLGLENPLKIKEITKVIDNKEKSAEIQIRDKNGRILAIKATRLLNPDKSLSLILIIDDITKSKMMDEKLKKLSSAVEQTGDIVFITDKNGKIEYVNNSFENQLGYTKDEVIGQTPRILKSGRHSNEHYTNMWDTILSGKVFQSVLTNKKKNSKIYYERKTITPIFDDRKNITHFVSIGKDITDEILSEKLLRESEEQYRDLFENAPIGYHNLGPDCTILNINKAELGMLGYSKEEVVLKKKWSEFIEQSQRKMFEKHWKRLITKGKISSYKYTLITKSWQKIHVILHATAKLDKNKKIARLQGCVIKLTF